jgi:hypothetical protein
MQELRVQPRLPERPPRERGPIQRRFRSLAPPSAAWWEKGALVLDDDWAALIDADGERHPFPPACRGGFLVSGTFRLNAGAPSNIARPFFFLATPASAGQRCVLILPPQGFVDPQLDDAHDLDIVNFAIQAGLEWTMRDYLVKFPEDEFPGYQHAPSLRDAVYDEATRRRFVSNPLMRMGTWMRHSSRSSR